MDLGEWISRKEVFQYKRYEIPRARPERQAAADDRRGEDRAAGNGRDASEETAADRRRQDTGRIQRG